jgi:hypothetical protein
MPTFLHHTYCAEDEDYLPGEDEEDAQDDERKKGRN